jgi:hypothetical protein
MGMQRGGFSSAKGRNTTKQRRTLMTEQPVTENNMAVIRETNACVLSRHELQNERRKILDMDFETDSRMWNKMKRRQIQQKQQQTNV